MTPIDMALGCGLVAVLAALGLLTLLWRPFPGEPSVRVHPEILDEARWSREVRRDAAIARIHHQRSSDVQPSADTRASELHNLVKLSDRRDVR